MHAGIESELKLRAESDDPLDRLAGLATLGAASLGPARTANEIDVYLDTADGRLAAARWACRHRTRGGDQRISLKGPAEHAPGAAVHRRPELEGPVGDPSRPASWPVSPARQLVLEVAGAEALHERLTLRQERTERTASVQGRPVGILSLDRVQVERDGRHLGDFRIVELELAEGVAPATVERLGAALGGISGLHPEPASKLELALALPDPAIPAGQ